jgi:NTP pyrophosphatase (non-canonical NTP hydrolase)
VPRRVEFPPILNGLDYLTSAMSLLRDEPEARELKYAVLHLQAAVEVLLKARLMHEHWSLVFRNPDKATRAAFSSGDFQSIGLEEILVRMKGIVGIDLPLATRDSIGKLAQVRNKLQHFGLVDQALTIESLAGEVLDALLVFITEEIQPWADATEQEALEKIQEAIRDEMNRISSLVEAREKRIQPALDRNADHVFQCPACSKLTLEIDEKAHCLFCDQTWSGEEAASEYAWTINGRSWHDVTEGGTQPVRVCPSCEYEAFIPDVIVRIDQRSPRWGCFKCGITAIEAEVGPCSKCGEVMFQNKETGMVCSGCWASI